MRGGSCAGKKIVGRLRAAEGKLHVRMRIDAAGDNEFAGGVYHFVHFHLKLRPDDGNDLAFDQDVSFVIVGCRDDATVTD